jgi:hypothetical protein
MYVLVSLKQIGLSESKLFMPNTSFHWCRSVSPGAIIPRANPEGACTDIEGRYTSLAYNIHDSYYAVTETPE